MTTNKVTLRSSLYKAQYSSNIGFQLQRESFGMNYNTVLPVLLCAIVVVYGQMPIPTHPLGYTYGCGKLSAPIQFSVYMGPACSDSKNAFPTILSVADYYGPDNVRLIVHLFPLPFHRTAFLASKGAHIVHVMNENQTFKWMASVYANLDKLSNDATHYASEAQVQNILTSIALSININGTTFSGLFKDRGIEDATRLDWKYSATRGVASTPSFMINEVTIPADPTWTVKDWISLIDPLLRRVSANEIPTN